MTISDIIAVATTPANVERAKRIETVNKVCKLCMPDTWLELRAGYVVVCWRDYRNLLQSRRWQTQGGQSFYPTWYRKWCHGGTCATALSQLVRWVQGRPVLPLSSWEYWCGRSVLLAGDNGDLLLSRLRAGGYPEHAACVLCGKSPIGRLDWWCLDGVSGPCCHHAEGCRQKGAIRGDDQGQ